MAVKVFAKFNGNHLKKLKNMYSHVNPIADVKRLVQFHRVINKWSLIYFDILRPVDEDTLMRTYEVMVFRLSGYNVSKLYWWGWPSWEDVGRILLKNTFMCNRFLSSAHCFTTHVWTHPITSVVGNFPPIPLPPCLCSLKTCEHIFTSCDDIPHAEDYRVHVGCWLKHQSWTNINLSWLQTNSQPPLFQT